VKLKNKNIFYHKIQYESCANNFGSISGNQAVTKGIVLYYINAASIYIFNSVYFLLLKLHSVTLIRVGSENIH